MNVNENPLNNFSPIPTRFANHQLLHFDEFQSAVRRSVAKLNSTFMKDKIAAFLPDDIVDFKMNSLLLQPNSYSSALIDETMFKGCISRT
jgi:hypothetical protein